MRKILCCVLVLALLAALPAWAVTGLAMVHGKGSAELANLDKAIEYWTPDMIKACTANYAYPYVVCHYDGTKWMWEAAGQVAGQIYDFINKEKIDDLVVVTHSFGGVVLRWICSNPDYDSRYPVIIKKIRSVNTIAAPQKGSEAADMADELSGSWLTSWLVEMIGQGTNATKNCLTSSMAKYNSTNLFGTPGRPALPKPFRWGSGYGLWNDLCLEDNGLAILSGVAGLPGEDDGCVAEYSAQAVGSKWFSTEANHHHNRRNDYRKIGELVAKVLTSRDDISSLSLGNDEQDGTLRFSGSMMPSDRGQTSYRAISTRYIDVVMLNPGETNRAVTIPLEKSEHAYVAVWPLHKAERGGEFTITLDAGNRRGMVVADKGKLELPIETNLPANGRVMVVEQPATGEYPLTIATSPSGEKQAYAVVVNTNSILTLAAYSSTLVAFTGNTISLFAELRDGANPVLGATVEAELYRDGGKEHTKCILTDDGLEGDQAADDGIYTARKVVGEEIALAPDAWFVRMTATGSTVAGEQFRRNAGFYFYHARCTGKISRPTCESCVKDKNGKISQLVFTVPVKIDDNGRYRLTGMLYANNAPVAWAMTTRKISAPGVTDYHLVFSCADITVDGPFTLNLDLFSLDRVEPAAEPFTGYVTAAYSASQFATARRGN